LNGVAPSSGYCRTQYESTTIQVWPGDLLVMFSDGLVEAANQQGEEYGDDRLATLLRMHADQTPAQLRASILQSLASFAPAGELQDDLTFAIIRFGTQACQSPREAAAQHEAFSFA
jgi:serine phosphatase RsbU (regulator of sigma subunit)